MLHIREIRIVLYGIAVAILGNLLPNPIMFTIAIMLLVLACIREQPPVVEVQIHTDHELTRAKRDAYLQGVIETADLAEQLGQAGLILGYKAAGRRHELGASGAFFTPLYTVQRAMKIQPYAAIDERIQAAVRVHRSSLETIDTPHLRLRNRTPNGIAHHGQSQSPFFDLLYGN